MCKWPKLCLAWTFEWTTKTKLHIQLMGRLQGQKMEKWPNVHKLKLPVVKEEFVTTFEHHFPDAKSNDWNSVKIKIYFAVHQVLCLITRNHQDWFHKNNAEIQALLVENHHQNNPSSVPKRDACVSKWNKVQKIDFASCMTPGSSNKTDEIQSYTDRHDIKCFYDSLKCVYELPTTVCSSVSMQMIQHSSWQI